ncbi:hypothetical protein OQA88_9712 [Cercophora sp. LCS_1]
MRSSLTPKVTSVAANQLARAPNSQLNSYSTNAEESNTTKKEVKGQTGQLGTMANKQPIRPKTQAELDAELKAKMEGLAGDGGESGVEYEDGQPVSMKRSVKNNMFRYI